MNSAQVAKRISVAQILFPIIALICLYPQISMGMALLGGMAFSLTLENPYASQTRKIIQRLLQLSIIGMGAGMDLRVVAQAGIHGIGYTALGILLTLVVGLLLGKALKTEASTSLLVSVGTAICGGSAIAAVSSTIRAKSDEMSMALATVFFLNAMALFIFPALGHHFDLGQSQFGLWSALAIHDTSSVVGATLQYGAEALQVGTTVKLTRALWIIPVSLLIGLSWNRFHAASKDSEKSTASSAKFPWFILGFLLVAALVTWAPSLQPAGALVSSVSKRTLAVTLFLIGAGISRSTLKNLGLRPFIQGVCLWAIVASATLFSIVNGWIK